jgi:hypothetical protein
MPDNNLFLQMIEAVYASALDSERLPEVLESTSRLLGAAGACFEIPELIRKFGELNVPLRLS